jgi:hypothetical protein
LEHPERGGSGVCVRGPQLSTDPGKADDPLDARADPRFDLKLASGLASRRERPDQRVDAAAVDESKMRQVKPNWTTFVHELPELRGQVRGDCDVNLAQEGYAERPVVIVTLPDPQRGRRCWCPPRSVHGHRSSELCRTSYPAAASEIRAHAAVNDDLA